MKKQVLNISEVQRGKSKRESRFHKLFYSSPKECILVSDLGTHIMCVCTYHQNVKLNLNNGDLANIITGTDTI